MKRRKGFAGQVIAFCGLSNMRASTNHQRYRSSAAPRAAAFADPANRKGLSPSAVLTCGTIALAIFLLTRSAAVGEAFCVTAYLIGFLSCRRVAALYPQASPIRWGWLAMSINCVLSLCRHTALIPKRLMLATDTVDFISQTLQLPALIFVVLGLGAMWWGVYRLGLGFRVRWWECAGILAAAALITWTFRNNLSHAHSSHGILTILQAVSLTLLIAIAGFGLLLHSLSMQMGGGRLAVVMRSVAAYALTRSLLNLSQGDGANVPMAWSLCFYAVPWIFAFGAAYSCWLTDGVTVPQTLVCEQSL